MMAVEQMPGATFNSYPISRRLLLIGSLSALLAGCDEASLPEQLPHGMGSAESPPKIEVPAPHADLVNSDNQQLALLGRYEQRLQRGFKELVLFRSLPESADQARDEARELASILHEYSAQGVQPHLIFEPTDQDVRALPFDAYRSLFVALRGTGITAAQLGTVTPLPEANTPLWGKKGRPQFGITDPALFVSNIGQFSNALRFSFPDATLGVLLDSQTYPNSDVGWSHGQYSSLAPYLRDLKGIARRFVLQGFPWMGPTRDGNSARQFNPTVFLPSNMAIEAAALLGVREVTFNTGTFASRYDWSPADRVSVGAPERERLLQGIITQAEKLQMAGLAPRINLFAQDKRQVEADWSYGDEASWRVLSDFVARCGERNIDISLFDSTERPVA